MRLGKVKAPSLREATKLLLLSPGWQSKAVCRVWLAAAAFRDCWVDMRRGTRTVVFAPPAAGKTTCFSIPYVYSCPGSSALIVIDPKGEIYHHTHRYRRRYGEVYCLDPMRIATENPDSANWLDLISMDSPLALDDCMAVGKALVVTTGHEHDLHFSDMAAFGIGGFTAVTVAELPEGDRNVQSVAELTSSPEAWLRGRQEMTASTKFGGLLSRIGGQIGHAVERELASIQSSIARHTGFLSSPAMVTSTTKSSFPLRQIIEPGNTTYLCLPPQYLESHSGWLRLAISSILRLVAATGLKPEGTIHLLAEEAGSLGSRFEVVENAIAQLRGYGLNIAFIYQSMAQLDGSYAQPQAFLAQMDTTIFMGPPRDYGTAEYVSKTLGDFEARTRTGSGGTNVGHSNDTHGMASSSSGANWGWQDQLLSRPLLRPDEVMRIGKRDAIVFPPAGVRPFMVRTVPFYSAEFWSRRGGSAALAFWCFWVAVVSVSLAIGVYGTLESLPRADWSSPQTEPPKWRKFHEVKHGEAKGPTKRFGKK